MALDEFESLVEREGSEAVYKLTRLQEIAQNKLQRLSLLCILRDLKVIRLLDASTRSTLQSNVIKLERYTKRQLVDIINDRVSLAFKPLTVLEETIDLVAALAFSEGEMPASPSSCYGELVSMQMPKGWILLRRKMSEKPFQA